MKRFVLHLFGFFAIWIFVSANMCTKVVVYGKDYMTEPVVREYSVDLTTALDKAQKAAQSLGYEVLRTDESLNRVTMGWKPVKSDSHYMDLFKRPDYAANTGSYYQLIVDFKESGSKVIVSAITKLKTVAGGLKSSHVVENEYLSRLDDLLRSPQIDITNVGMEER